MDFKIGDTVSLKQGGHKMQVEYIVGHELPENCTIYYRGGVTKGAVICKWINEDGAVQGSVFSPEDLHLVDIHSVL